MKIFQSIGMFTPAAMFNVQLVVMIGIRKLLDFVFEPRELKILDDILPEITRRKKEEERQKRASLASQVTSHGFHFLAFNMDDSKACSTSQYSKFSFAGFLFFLANSY